MGISQFSGKCRSVSAALIFLSLKRPANGELVRVEHFLITVSDRPEIGFLGYLKLFCPVWDLMRKSVDFTKILLLHKQIKQPTIFISKKVLCYRHLSQVGNNYWNCLRNSSYVFLWRASGLWRAPGLQRAPPLKYILKKWAPGITYFRKITFFLVLL